MALLAKSMVWLVSTIPCMPNHAEGGHHQLQLDEGDAHLPLHQLSDLDHHDHQPHLHPSHFQGTIFLVMLPQHPDRHWHDVPGLAPSCSFHFVHVMHKELLLLGGKGPGLVGKHGEEGSSEIT